MSNTDKQIDAATVRDKILNAKGNFVKAKWKSNPKPAAKHKGILLEKHTTAVIQAGVDYANLSSVKDAIASGERGEVEELPWGEWYVDPLTKKSWFPYVITHKDTFYLRMTTSNGHNHKASSVFYVDGEEVTKEEFAEYLTAGESKKLLDKDREGPPVFNVKLDNLMDLPQDI